MKTLYIYSEGGSYNNGYKDPNKPMFGSYGSIIVKNNEIIKEYTSYFKDITNNQGELYGFIKAIMQFIKSYKSGDVYHIIVVSDSQYLVNGVNLYLDGWKKKGWKTASGDEVKNKEMWKIIDYIINFSDNILFEFQWQRGHKGKKVTKEEDPNIYFNEYCDSLATGSINKALKDLEEHVCSEINFKDIINNYIKTFKLNGGI